MIPVFLGVLLVVTFFVLRPLSDSGGYRFVRVCVGVCLTMVPLIVLCEGLPPRRGTTMMTISLAWMVAIKVIHYLTLTDEERLILVEKDKPKPTAWSDFGGFLLSYLWFAMPIIRRLDKGSQASPTQALPVGRLTREVLSEAGYGIVKLYLADLTSKWLLECLEQLGEDSGERVLLRDSFLTMQYIPLFASNVIFGTGTLDILRAIVLLLSLGRYTTLCFNDWPILSSSPRELWGRRYNKLVGGLLHDTVFESLRTRLKWSPTAAGFAAFGVSGLLHFHVARVTFRMGQFNALLFFLLHAVACSIDFRRLNPHPLIGGCLTQLFVIVTGPLYLGLFLYASPAWLLLNHTQQTFPPAALPAPPFCPRPLGLMI